MAADDDARGEQSIRSLDIVPKAVDMEFLLDVQMTFFDSFDEFDGGVYNAGKWAPDLGFVNSRSSAVIWPPGYLHETSTLPTKDGSCSASVTVVCRVQDCDRLNVALYRLSMVFLSLYNSFELFFLGFHSPPRFKVLTG